jgi:hypothetical protein
MVFEVKFAGHGIGLSKCQIMEKGVHETPPISSIILLTSCMTQHTPRTVATCSSKAGLGSAIEPSIYLIVSFGLEEQLMKLTQAYQPGLSLPF